MSAYHGITELLRRGERKMGRTYPGHGLQVCRSTLQSAIFKGTSAPLSVLGWSLLTWISDQTVSN